MKKRNIYVGLAVLFLSFFSLAAQASEYVFDKAHSSFRFGVQHIYSTIYGHFDEYEGKIIFDPANLAQSSFSFIIKTDSIQTGIAKRDNHLLSGDFFDVRKYPEIVFKSSSITYIEGEEYKVAGTLKIKDVSQEIVLPVRFHGVKDHPADKTKRVAGFDFSTTIDRLSYNVGDGKFVSMGLVGKDVRVMVSLEMLVDK